MKKEDSKNRYKMSINANGMGITAVIVANNKPEAIEKARYMFGLEEHEKHTKIKVIYSEEK